MINKRIKKSSFLKENYGLCWKFIKESRKFIYIIMAVFFAFTLFGFFIPVPDSLREELLKILEEIVKRTEGMSQFELTRFIFFNNAQSSFIGLILGVFLGIFPIFLSLFNGYILGFVASVVVGTDGGGVLWRILPHGIFELPAVFISLGLGLRIGMQIFQHIDVKSFKYYSYEMIRVFIFVVIPLLIIAAVIEGSLISFSD